jgi:surfeit locus 1 family protein
VPAVFTLVGVAILVSLGNWQVRRLAWKEDLIARVAERPNEPAVDLGAARFADLSDTPSFLAENEYRTASMAGEYRPQGEVLAFTALADPKGAYGGPGFWVMTPFAVEGSGLVVYVNRGFVPQARKRDYAPPPAGETIVRGLIRSPELGSAFTPAPDLKERVFYARDVARIARETDAGPVAGFFVDLLAGETPPGGLPQAGESRMTFPNDHLQYAITWYGLAAALLGIFLLSALHRFRERHDKAA